MRTFSLSLENGTNFTFNGRQTHANSLAKISHPIIHIFLTKKLIFDVWFLEIRSHNVLLLQG